MTNGAAEMRLFSEENMKILLFRNFQKKQNSTKRPADAAGVEIDITLKDPTSWTAPVFVLQGVEPGNYVKWEGRYYYVNDCIRSTRGIVQLVCSIDALATAYSEILATAAYVTHSASDYTLHIRDGRYTPSQETSRTVSTVSLTEQQGTEPAFFNSDGCYILTTISESPDGVNGATTLYALTAERIEEFMRIINEPSVIQAVEQLFGKPMEAIVRCHWVPFSYTSLSGEEESMKISSYDTEVLAKRLTYYRKTVYRQIPLPHIGEEHTDSFLDVDPYTTGILYLPFVGCVSADYNAIYPQHSLTVKIDVDLLTGSLVYLVGTTAGNVYYMRTYSGSCTSEMPISKQQSNYVGMATGTATVIGGLVTAAAAALTGGAAAAVAGGVATALGGAGATIRAAEVHTQTNGSISSRIGAYTGLNIVLTSVQFGETQRPMDADRIALMGLVCNKVRSISGLTGYVQTSGFNLGGSQIQSIRDAVNAAMDAGVYIE